MCQILINRVVRGKPAQRTIDASIEDKPGAKYPVLTIVDEHNKVEKYRLTELPNCDFGGRGFSLEKLDGTTYAVHVSDRDEECHCECTGFLRFGWCKHPAAVRGLIDDGELPDPRCDPREDAAVQSDPLRCQHCGCEVDLFESFCSQCQQLEFQASVDAEGCAV